MFNFFKRKTKNPQDELKAFVGGYELPTFSTAVITVLSKLREPEVSITEIAPLIELDPGMTVKILRLVNSAGFGLTTKAGNLQHAIMLLGCSRLEGLVLSFGVSDSLPSSMKCMDRGNFWATAARRACLARIIAGHFHTETQAECFTVGLLMDMAIPILDTYYNDVYGNVIATWLEDEECQLSELEQEQFGYDHASIGALMAEAWELPQYIVDSIAAHHLTEGKNQAEPAVQLVSLMEYYDDNNCDRLIEVAQEKFNMEKSLIEEMVTTSFSYADEFASTFR